MFMCETYQICQRVQLLTHKTALASRPCDHAIEEVEEQPERHKPQREPEFRLVGRIDAVAHGRGYRHEAAEAIHERDQVGKMICADQAEVSRIRSAEQSCLLVLRCSNCQS